MAQPTARDLHVDQLLTNVSLRYSNPEGIYIADKIFPIVNVEHQSDIVPRYNQSFWFRDDAKERGPGTKSQGGGWTVDLSQTYFAKRYSFREEIPDDVRRNADAPFNMDIDATDFVTDKMFMRREVNLAAAAFGTGKWVTDYVGGTDFTVWSNYGASSPLTDITTYRDYVEGLIGREPNRLVMGKQVWSQLRWHPDLIDTIKYTQKGVVSQELAASLFDMPANNFLIGRALYTTSPEGTAEASVVYQRIWGKNVLMVYTPDAPALRTPASGYTFVWKAYVGQTGNQWVKRMRDEEREVDIIEGNTNFAQSITATRAGVFLSAAVA